MVKRRNVMALLLSVVFVTVFAAPLVQSGDGDVHMVYKDLNGPPSTCAETWDFTPAYDGTWQGLIKNYGMRWVIIDVLDMDTQALLMDREMFRFAVFGNEFPTPAVDIAAGHKIQVTATPNGPMDTWLTVEDVIELEVPENEPPVAAFTYSVDGLTVSVDASASDDIDGSIVSYEWQWGDGTTSVGMLATHTYTQPDSESYVVRGTDPPWNVCGFVFAADGVTPVGFAVVTVTNLDKVPAVSAVVTAFDYGMYEYDMNLLGAVDGTNILVEAVSPDGLWCGEIQGVADKDSGMPYLWMDVTLDTPVVEPPEPFEMIITLTVKDDDGAIAVLSIPVMVNP